ncbi:hypothetical protein DL93DRAFT_2083065 [Clavulina sp. PMI_390]|nr:hypothetical protein DL93DRAFT_2083065 [Clavulina sp. PMI_390]
MDPPVGLFTKTVDAMLLALSRFRGDFRGTYGKLWVSTGSGPLSVLGGVATGSMFRWLNAAMVAATEGVAGPSSGSAASPSDERETDWNDEVERDWPCPLLGAAFSAACTSRNCVDDICGTLYHDDDTPSSPSFTGGETRFLEPFIAIGIAAGRGEP